MSKLDTLPPIIADMIIKIRDDTQHPNYRETLAGRLEVIAEVCQAEAQRYRNRRQR